MRKESKGSALALLPLIIFLGVYLLGALIAGDFYKMPIVVAAMFASMCAVGMTRQKTLSESIGDYSRGATDVNIMLMIWIFVLAGAFAASTKSMGAVDATVALALRVIPEEFLPAGIFIAACFTSLSVGTSVGTIVALTPIASAVATQIGCSTPWMVAIVVGGAFFGDNLSFISDTTIAATQSQGCKMRDKFRTNLLIVLPSAIATLMIYLFSDISEGVVAVSDNAEWFRTLPYMVVIGCALSGMNVLGVLMIGIFVANVIGFACNGGKQLKQVGIADNLCFSQHLGNVVNIILLSYGNHYHVIRFAKSQNIRGTNPQGTP